MESEREGLRAFEITPNVHVELDENGYVRHLEHVQEPYTRMDILQDSHELAEAYLVDVAKIYEIDGPFLNNLDQPISNMVTDEGTELRFAEEKSLMGTDTVSFVQTHFGLPIWQAGVSVTVQNGPLRITSSHSTFHLRAQFTKPGQGAECFPDNITEQSFKNLLGTDVQNDPQLARGLDQLKINSKRLLMYQYDPDARLSPKPPYGKTLDTRPPNEAPLRQSPPTLPLPAVPETIIDGMHYVVCEILFTLALPDWGSVNWRAFVEVDKCIILYLRALVSSFRGKVFTVDPVTDSGSIVTTASPGPVLTSISTCQPLDHLNAIVSGLEGDYVNVTNSVVPNNTPPSCDFDYDPQTDPDEFSSVSGYFHGDRAFQMIRDLGFDVHTYFDGTSFPIPVEIDGAGYDAHTSPNGSGDGVGGFWFGRAHPYQNIGTATSKRAVLHEFGHAMLWDSIHDANFGFAHSPGDSLAAIVCDPGSGAHDRFETFPWLKPVNSRRHDRCVRDGWCWGGDNDWANEIDHQYLSEQILSTTLFRAYLAAGGDAVSINPVVRHRFASDFLAYLIVRAVGSLATSPITPTPSAGVFATALMNANVGVPALTGHVSGAFHKVIRWAFEKQGLYRPPVPPGANANGVGLPPDIDVYIDDGRDGEYTYQENYWSSRDIWNRLHEDGGTTHETPIVGQTNYVYVRVKNRGAQQATNVVVKAYHAAPAAGLVWKDDWTEMTLDPAAVVNAISPGGSDIVGPFKWIPSVNGHECLLATVSAAGDLSNVDPSATLPCGVGPTPNWQLVPFDNNIAQRNVAPVPGGGGKKNLVAALKGRTFRVKNPYDYPAHVSIESTIPLFLENLGWHMKFSKANTTFTLQPRGHRDVPVHLVPGPAFSHADVTQPGRNPEIELRALIDGQLVGGITYEIDPNMKKPAPE